MEQNRKQFPSLTGLKAVMCLFVVFYHTLPVTPLMDAIPLTSMLRYIGGHVANGVFFMISGYLMVNSYRDRISSGSVSFGPSPETSIRNLLLIPPKSRFIRLYSSATV